MYGNVKKNIYKVYTKIALTFHSSNTNTDSNALNWKSSNYKISGFHSLAVSLVGTVQFVTISGSLMSSLYTSWIVNWIRNIF